MRWLRKDIARIERKIDPKPEEPVTFTITYCEGEPEDADIVIRGKFPRTDPLPSLDPLVASVKGLLQEPSPPEPLPWLDDRSVGVENPLEEVPKPKATDPPAKDAKLRLIIGQTEYINDGLGHVYPKPPEGTHTPPPSEIQRVIRDY